MKMPKLSKKQIVIGLVLVAAVIYLAMKSSNKKTIANVLDPSNSPSLDKLFTIMNPGIKDSTVVS